MEDLGAQKSRREVGQLGRGEAAGPARPLSAPPESGMTGTAERRGSGAQTAD